MRRDERRSGRDRRDDTAWQSVPLEMTIATETDLAEALVAAATLARTRAQARYSGFKVGAALETSDGDVVTGCNVENATYGLTLCAERVALVKALSEGHAVFTRIVVVADTENSDAAVRVLPPAPLGILRRHRSDPRQPGADHVRRCGCRTLLPMPFDARLLE